MRVKNLEVSLFASNYKRHAFLDPIGSTATQQQVSTTVVSSTVSSKPVNITCGEGIWTNIGNRCFTFGIFRLNPCIDKLI
jgi:hypothetical protein